METRRFFCKAWIGVITSGLGLLISSPGLSDSRELVERSRLSLHTFERPSPINSIEGTSSTGFRYAGVKDDQEVIRLWNSFQQAVASGDQNSIADMVNYPFRVNFYDDPPEKNYRIMRNKNELVRNFDRIFDGALKDLIRTTPALELGGNYHGILTPRGEIWIGVFCINDNNDCQERYEIKLRTIHANSAFIDRH